MEWGVLLNKCRYIEQIARDCILNGDWSTMPLRRVRLQFLPNPLQKCRSLALIFPCRTFSYTLSNSLFAWIHRPSDTDDVCRHGLPSSQNGVDLIAQTSLSELELESDNSVGMKLQRHRHMMELIKAIKHGQEVLKLHDYMPEIGVIQNIFLSSDIAAFS